MSIGGKETISKPDGWLLSKLLKFKVVVHYQLPTTSASLVPNFKGIVRPYIE